ncbi:MAG: hypothetical protein GY810_12075 [Aureispira sp.]|nr:hypothetical protein [Aureispira sp.]
MKIIFILSFFVALNSPQAQLEEYVRQINPELFMNNIDNERLFAQELSTDDYLSFNRTIQRKNVDDQAYQYHLLPTKENPTVLEFRVDSKTAFDETTNSAGEQILSEELVYQDFGLTIYTLENKKWKKSNVAVFPEGFESKLQELFPQLVKGSDWYFYNQELDNLVEVSYNNKKLIFSQAGEAKISLKWKKEQFSVR